MSPSLSVNTLRGRGFSRSNLIYMRKFYLTFPKSETLSHQLTWSHYFELLKCDDPVTDAVQQSGYRTPTGETGGEDVS